MSNLTIRLRKAPPPARPAWRALALAALLPLASCDLGVTNPKSISDDSLDDPRVIPALVTGAAGQVAVATTGRSAGSTAGLYMAVALFTDELVHSGLNLGFRSLSDGVPSDETPDAEVRWANAQGARWTAERAISRIGALVPDSAANLDVATVTLWAGFANRMIGENFCNAVVDGGPALPPEEALKRAEAHFTSAIQIATAAGNDSLALAATGGRAQTRLLLKNWTGAVEDASKLPTEYVLDINHSPSTESWNTTVAFSFDGLRGEATVWGTPFAEWGRNRSDSVHLRTGDVRVSYDTPRDSLRQYYTGSDGRRPRWRQYKYDISGDDTDLVTGTEMRLIEAEAMLVAGDWQGAVARINEVRAHQNELIVLDAEDLPMVSAGSQAEAWLLLMKERGIETWLEGRRLGDLRRWTSMTGIPPVPFTVVRREATGQPAASDPRVPVTEVSSLCLPVSRTEKLTNPNF